MKSFRKRSGEEDPRAKKVLLEGIPSGIVDRGDQESRLRLGRREQSGKLIRGKASGEKD